MLHKVEALFETENVILIGPSGSGKIHHYMDSTLRDRTEGSIFVRFFWGAPELSFDNQDSNLHPRLFIREDISYAGTAFYLLSLPVVLIQQSGPVKNWRYGDCLLVSCHNLKK